MAIQDIKIGTTTNDGAGDNLRVGAVKINDNNAEFILSSSVADTRLDGYDAFATSSTADSASFDYRISAIVTSGSGADWDVNLFNIPTGIVSGSSQLEIEDLSNVNITGSVQDQILKFSSGSWVNATQFHTFFENYVIVAKTGGNFDTIQAGIEYANTNWPSRSFNDPVVVIVYSGEYREQIHSYQHIIIISSADGYDPAQGQAKATIINTGDDPSNYPLRTDPGDVYYMVGMSTITDTDNGVAGRIPEGTFKNCSFWNNHFIENAENSVSQFQDCKWGSDIYGGFYLTGSTSPGSGNILINGSRLVGNPVFTSDTHTAPDTVLSFKNTEIQGSLTVGGDWSITADNITTHGVAARNTFDTAKSVKILGGSMVNGVHFVQSPIELSLSSISFSSLNDNLIPDGEADITADAVIEGVVQNNIMRNGYSSEIHMDNPDKYVGHEINDSYISIKAALDSITDSSASKRYTIQVSAGLYTEDNPLQGKEYVAMKSTGDLQTTRIIAGNPNQDLMIMANLFTIEGMALWGVSGATNYAIRQDVAGSTSISRIIFGECTNAILVNHDDTQLVANDIAVFNPTVSLIRGVYCTAGICNIYSYNANFGQIGTMLEVTGATSTSILNNINSLVNTVQTAVKIGDLARVVISSATLISAVDGIVCEGGSDTRINASSFFFCQNDAIRINDVGTNTSLSVMSSTIESSGNFDTNILSSTALLTGFAKTSIDKFNFVAGARFFGVVIDVKEDDEGFNVLGKFHVGIPEKGTESVFGGGNSYTRGMLVYSETNAGVFTDRTTEARSASTSTFTFDGITANNSIYVASSLSGADVLEHYGINANINSAAVLGTGNIIIEYWNGTAWIRVNGMSTHDNFRYIPHGSDYFSDTGRHHIRYDSSLAVDGWTKYDPIGMNLGTDYYWIRFRIDADITSAPIFEQFKLHTSRSEINGDGWLEYFGKARPIGQLASSFSAANPFEGNMGNQDLYISTDLGVGYLDNTFTATSDKTGIEQYLPFDADTSSPITLQWSGRFSVSHTPTFTIRWGWVKQGDVYYTADPTTTENNAKVTTVSRAVTLNTVEEFEVNLDVNEMRARRESGQGDKLMISMQVSTLTGTFSIGPSQATYTKWCEGGHI